MDYKKLHELFEYDGTSLRWKKDKGRGKKGQKAGTSSFGYRKIIIDGKKYMEHRLVWLYIYGEWPTSNLDHINNIRDDNSIENLREATIDQNNQNTTSRKGSSSQYLGVSWDKENNKWRSSITINKKNKCLGRFLEEEEAALAYNKAATEAHGEFANLNQI